MYKLKFIILFLLPLIILSCRSTRNLTYDKSVREKLKINSEADRKSVEGLIKNSLAAHQYEFSTWSAKINLEVNAEGGSRNLTANVRIAADSLIWVSATVVMGIEAARIKITPDSILIINKIEKTLIRRGFDEVTKITGLPVSFQQMQQIITGQPISTGSVLENWEVNHQPLEVILKLINGSFISRLTLEPVNLYIVNEEVDFAGGIRAGIKYQSYSEISGRQIAIDREMIIDGLQRMNIKMKVRDVLFNEALSFPFSIPQNYPEI